MQFSLNNHDSAEDMIDPPLKARAQIQFGRGFSKYLLKQVPKKTAARHQEDFACVLRSSMFSSYKKQNKAKDAQEHTRTASCTRTMTQTNIFVCLYHSIIYSFH